MTRRQAALLCAALLLAAGSCAFVMRAPARLAPSARAAIAARDTAALWAFFDTERTAIHEHAARIAQAGGRIRHVSALLDAVSFDAAPGVGRRVAKLPAVARVQAVAQLRRAHIGSEAAARTRTAQSFYGANEEALRELGIPIAHEAGFTGFGINIGILDTGFERDHDALRERNLLNTRDFIGNDAVVWNEPGDPVTFDQELHGTAVWSLIGGYDPEDLVGPAYHAWFLLAKVDDERFSPGPSDTQADEDRWVAGAEWAADNGARIISSSINFRDRFIDREPIPIVDLNGDITVTTRAADRLARRGVLVLNSIGNGGPTPQSLAAPADADSIIAVGAIDANGVVAAFSARGPTSDRRIKPDLVARGVDLTVADSRAPDAYRIASGTSFATPLLAGGAALVMEAWPLLTAPQIDSALRASASNTRFPNNNIGWGLPNIASAIMFPRGLHASGVSTVDIENRLTTVAPTFSWNAPLIHPTFRPIRYTLEIATDSMFDRIVFADTATSATQLTVRRALQPAPRLYWRVRAESVLGAVRTTLPARPVTMPPWVRLTTLADPQVVFTDSVRPEFRWESLAAPAPVGPFEFELQVLSASGQVVQRITRAISPLRLPVPLTPNQSYRWRLIARTQLIGTVRDSFVVESPSPFVVTSTSAPPATLLYPSFPNPFPRNGVAIASIWFDLAQRTPLELAVHDLRGRLVRRLIPADPSCGEIALDAGIYGRGNEGAATDPCILTHWDARDQDGAFVLPGVYLLRMRANGREQVQRVLYNP